jgi:hypothetical protein
MKIAWKYFSSFKTAKLDVEGKPIAWQEWNLVAKQGTSSMNVSEGSATEMKDEDGNVVDSFTEANKYELTLGIIKRRGDKKPIEDVNGMIIDNYAVKAMYKDATLGGFLFANASVSVADTWTAADGEIWQYKFVGLLPSEPTQEFIKVTLDGNGIPVDNDGDPLTVYDDFA